MMSFKEGSMEGIIFYWSIKNVSAFESCLFLSVTVTEPIEKLNLDKSQKGDCVVTADIF